VTGDATGGATEPGRARRRVGILISGRGSNMVALIEAARRPDYPAEIVLVISNRPDAAGLAHARDMGVRALAIDHTSFPRREAFDDAVDAALRAEAVEFVCHAGFMRIQSDAFASRWIGRQINIHPSLLPLFKGLHPHKQALEAGVRLSGCTVHFVTPDLDGGPIIAQGAVPVVDGDTPDTLADRILAVEHQIYPHALALIASGAARLEGGRVTIAGPINQMGRLISPAPAASR
jgi:phosphoribosylglycinamide formyltransferase 1